MDSLKVQLHKPSSLITTFNAPFGRYRWLRLPFGIKTNPEEYQRRTHESLPGLKGTEDIVDDILCVGNGDTYKSAFKDLERNLIALLERCREKNFDYNPKPYIGPVLTPDFLKPYSREVKAILAMPTPSDKEVPLRLLGMITYIAKFVPNLSDVTEPLRLLSDKDVQWQWNETHEKSLKHVKQLITMERVLKYFEPSKEVTLQLDTSVSGLGAVTLQSRQEHLRALKKIMLN